MPAKPPALPLRTVPVVWRTVQRALASSLLENAKLKFVISNSFHVTATESRSRRFRL
jgi:hypothetical protein